MRPVTFYVNVEPPEIRIAEVRDGRLFDLDVERDSRALGDIYYGLVENIVPGMDAAFVDIGTGRNALIYVGDVGDEKSPLPIEKLLKSGQPIVVQIARAPVGSKGARVSARLSLPGRYTVLSASSDSVGVSRRIESADERERLRKIVERARPLDHGVIVRTEGENASAEAIAADVNFLHRQLEGIKERAKTTKKPTLLHRDLGALGRLARDRMNEGVEKVVIDRREEYEWFHALVEMIAPQLADRIVLHESASPLFDGFNIARDISRAGNRHVHLPHGGVLVIDEAEAFCAIDVNSGKFTGKNRLADTVVKVNLEAVEEIARQLRLRNIGGVVVIDFIDMERQRDRIAVMNALETALKQDRTRTRIVQLSPLGLVEMTRRREGDSLRQTLHRTCPYCSGDGVVKTTQSVAIDARRQIRALAATAEIDAVCVTLHPDVALAFIGEGAPSEIGARALDLEAVCGFPVWVRVDFSLHSETVVIERGTSSQFEALYPTFGSRLLLPADATLAPRGKDESPEWAVVSQCLVRLEASNAALLGRPAVVEFIEVDRHYQRARVLTSVDPRDA
ncbi:MAG TPA: Rne/Rng family ribonuclease [Abditibacteriaceae bacterium]|jgi:ribonuclease G